MSAAIRWGVFLLLAGFFLWRGIIPAFTRVETDFPNYYTAARLYVEGADLARFYDDAWFARQIRDHGIDADGKFSPFPPLTLFVMMPLSWLPPLGALEAWTVINLALLGGIWFILRKLVAAPPLIIAGIILGGGIGLANNFRFGQWYVMLLFLMTWGYYFWQKGSPALAGILFGIGASVKYFPLLFLLLFALRREWKGAIACLGTFLLLNLAGVAILGLEMYGTFLRNVLWHHLSANMQNPFSASFQSWESLFRRLFVADPALNPRPVLDWPPGVVIGTALVVGCVILITLRTVVRLQNAPNDHTFALQFLIVTLMGLAILPASATYHYILLALPLALVLLLRAQLSGAMYCAIFVLYFVLGFIPYRLFTRFDGDGLFSVLAYPRLAVMTALLSVTLILTERAFLQAPRHSFVTHS